jgi:hypothetical protein
LKLTLWLSFVLVYLMMFEKLVWNPISHLKQVTTKSLSLLNANSRRHSQPPHRHHFFSSWRLHSFIIFIFRFQFHFHFFSILISDFKFFIFQEWLVDRKRVPADWRKRVAAIKARISKEFSSLPKDSDPLFQTLDPEG